MSSSQTVTQLYSHGFFTCTQVQSFLGVLTVRISILLVHKLVATGYDLNIPPHSVTEVVWDEAGLSTFQDVLSSFALLCLFLREIAS